MTTKIKFRVYELNRVMGSEKHMALELVYFPGYTVNNFDSEVEAYDALVEHELFNEDYVILKTVHIGNY